MVVSFTMIFSGSSWSAGDVLRSTNGRPHQSDSSSYSSRSFLKASSVDVRNARPSQALREVSNTAGAANAFTFGFVRACVTPMTDAFMHLSMHMQSHSHQHGNTVVVR